MSDNGVSKLIETVWRDFHNALVAQGASAANNNCGASFFGHWLHSPLAFNTYETLPDLGERRQTSAPMVTGGKRSNAASKSGGVLEQKLAAQSDGARSKIRILDLKELNKHAQPTNTAIEIVRQRGSQQATVAVTTLSYNGRTQIGVDSLTNVFGADQRSAIETLKDSMEQRFASSGLVVKIAQTLLVLVLEPVNMTLEMEVYGRFDNNIIGANLLEIMKEHRKNGTAVASADISALADEEEEFEEGERMRQFRNKIRKSTVNIFPRFMELAIDCTDIKSEALLRSVFAIWIAANNLFDTVSMLPHKEAARNVKPEFVTILEDVFADRAPLLCAVIISNIEGIGAYKWLSFRQLFVAALAHASTLVGNLCQQKPGHRRFQRARESLSATHIRVSQYVHSSAQQSMRSSALAALEFEFGD